MNQDSLELLERLVSTNRKINAMNWLAAHQQRLMQNGALMPLMPHIPLYLNQVASNNHFEHLSPNNIFRGARFSLDAHNVGPNRFLPPAFSLTLNHHLSNLTQPNIRSSPAVEEITHTSTPTAQVSPLSDQRSPVLSSPTSSVISPLRTSDAAYLSGNNTSEVVQDDQRSISENVSAREKVALKRRHESSPKSEPPPKAKFSFSISSLLPEIAHTAETPVSSSTLGFNHQSTFQKQLQALANLRKAYIRDEETSPGVTNPGTIFPALTKPNTLLLDMSKASTQSNQILSSSVYSGLVGRMQSDACQEALRIATEAAGIKSRDHCFDDDIRSMKQRRSRAQYTPWQIAQLDREFKLNQYPDIQCREGLAKKLNLIEARVQVWFQNRRAKMRRTLRIRGKLSSELMSKYHGEQTDGSGNVTTAAATNTVDGDGVVSGNNETPQDTVGAKNSDDFSC